VNVEEAIGLIADRLGSLRAAGRPEGLALLAGYCAGTMQDLWRLFLQSYGSPNYVADDYDEGATTVMQLMHGIPKRPGYDLERSDLVLSFGAPLYESWWSPLQAYVGVAPAPGIGYPRARLVQVDTRFSRTAARAHEWVGVRPETHAVLALGIAYVMIRDELIDLDFIAEYVSGFDDYIDEHGHARDGFRSLVMSNYRTEEVSGVTGVPVERITAIARAFGESRWPIAVFGSDVMQSRNGLLAAMAVHSLNVLKGNVNRPGGVVFGDDPPLAPIGPAVFDEIARSPRSREPVGGPGNPFADRVRPRHFAEAVADDAGEPIEALLLYYADPLASSTHPEVWRTALDRIPFVVSFSPFLDETTDFADIVLPDLLPYERWQDGPTPASFPYAVWGLAQPLVEPHPGAVHTGEVLLALARALGGSVAESMPYEGFESLLEARATGLFEARRGMTFGNEFEREHHRQMEERGWWLPQHADFDSFWEGLVDAGGWMDLYYDDTDPARIARTPDGRIRLLPAELDARGSEANPYADVGPGDGSSDDEYPYRLLPYRFSTLSSGSARLQRWMVEKPTIFPDVHYDPWVEVNPSTVRELGLTDGDYVWVVSRRGRYRARLKAFPGTAPENICAPYGLKHPDGELASPLQILDGAEDPLTGVTSWSSTAVRLDQA
jgi:anaerobic selenocysteine-containing dehydrogenase